MPEREYKRPHFTKSGTVRYRFYNPKSFKKFRTLDIGRKGHSRLIQGLDSKSNEWYTQAAIITKEDYDNGTRWEIKNNKPKIIHIRQHNRKLK